MIDALSYIAAKWNLDLSAKSPIEIPNVTREDLAVLFHELGVRKCAEIGVESGAYSEVLCRSNPGVEHYAIDSWRRLPRYKDHVNPEKFRVFYERAKARLAPYNATLIKELSMDAVKQFQDGSLDAVYIDGAHDFQSVANDIAEWSRKVRPGGIVAGHDYLVCPLPSLMHVPLVVDNWCRAYDIRPLLIFGAKEKVEGVKRDDGRSWAFVVPEPRVYPKQRRPIQQ